MLYTQHYLQHICKLEPLLRAVFVFNFVPNVFRLVKIVMFVIKLIKRLPHHTCSSNSRALVSFFPREKALNDKSVFDNDGLLGAYLTS